MGQFLDINAFDWVATDIPWADRPSKCEHGQHQAQGSGFVHDVAEDCLQYIRDLARLVKAARPKVKVLVYFHAFLSGEANATTKYARDRLLDDQGKQLCYDRSVCAKACEEWPVFYGTSTNEYGKQLDAYVDKVFDLGADGIYHDESAFSETDQDGKDFGHILYSPSIAWDGVTVATAATNSSAGLRPVVTGLPSATPLVRLQHKKELYSRVYEKGGMVVANDPPVTRSFRLWLVEQNRLHATTAGKQGGVAIHFAETGQQVRGRVVQLYTPVMLDRCGTESQAPDDDPKYNHTVGISAGLNIGAHLDFGVLSVMCSEWAPFSLAENALGHPRVPGCCLASFSTLTLRWVLVQRSPLQTPLPTLAYGTSSNPCIRSHRRCLGLVSLSDRKGP